MTNPSGLMMTIASDEEIEAEEDTDSGGESEQQPGTLPKTAPTNAGNKRGRPKKGRGSVEKKHAEVDPGFSFDVDSSLGIAESQAIKGWDFKSEFSTYEYRTTVPYVRVLACDVSRLKAV